ncbi:MAG: aminotransferase class V-fold PLP-dependent enzyme [Chloroflexi bacterium]|nr:aminotransferase class V-fold PLP-dependent enzyme [Chloroflexota bacterium]
MSSTEGHGIYGSLGVRPVINALGGQYTRLGGSILSPEVNQAMQEANRYFVDMQALLERTGEIIAGLLGAEAACVTSGCCAALALGTAACMAGSDPERMEQLPDIRGMKHEVIVQKGLRSKYDRCLTVPGGRLVEVGGASGSSAAQIEAAIGDQTTAIHYLAPSRSDGVVSLEEVVRIGKRRGIPVIVDAAGQVYPVEKMRWHATMGADLVCFGAKYFGAPNSTGVLCGRKDLVEAAMVHSFVGFENTPYRTFGRPMKLDRQEIIAVVVALRQWLTMDHQARFDSYARRVDRLQKRLGSPAHMRATPQGSPVTALQLSLDESALGKTAASIAEVLRNGDPSILVRTEANNLTVSVVTLVDGDEEVVADRLKALLCG